mgnify:CR=1 FL=1
MVRVLRPAQLRRLERQAEVRHDLAQHALRIPGQLLVLEHEVLAAAQDGVEEDRAVRVGKGSTQEMALALALRVGVAARIAQDVDRDDLDAGHREQPPQAPGRLVGVRDIRCAARLGGGLEEDPVVLAEDVEVPRLQVQGGQAAPVPLPEDGVHAGPEGALRERRGAAGAAILALELTRHERCGPEGRYLAVGIEQDVDEGGAATAGAGDE